MSADVGFTPGKLIEAAQGIGATAEPISQSVAPMGEDITSLSAGLNGSYMEPLGNAMTAWGDSLTVLFDDLGRLAEALVGVERAFSACEDEIIQSLVQAASGSESGDDGRPRVVCTRSCRLWLGKVLMEANSEQRFDAGVPGG